MSCAIRFGVGNIVEDADLTGTPEPNTNINWLKNSDRSKKVRITDLSSDTLVIEGVLESPQWAGFLAIPGSNLKANAEVKLELFESSISTSDLLGMDYALLGSMIPLGLWRAGIDPYGVASEQKNIYAQWFDSPIQFQRFKLSVKHGYTIDPSPPLTGEILQDESTGVVSINATTADVEAADGTTWVQTADGTATGGYKMVHSGSKFYTNHMDGPKLKFKFRATKSGAHTAYMRVKLVSNANSCYVIWDGYAKYKIIPIQSGWVWVEARTVTLTAGIVHGFTIAERDPSFTVDHIVIQPTGDPVPTGTGPVESTQGPETSGENVELRMLIIGETVQLDNAMSYGNAIKFMTDPNIERTYSGFAVETGAQQEARTLSLDLEVMSKGDKIKLAEMEKRLDGRPFMVSAYPERDEWTRDNYTMLGRFANSLTYIDADASHHQTQQTIIEA